MLEALELVTGVRLVDEPLFGADRTLTIIKRQLQLIQVHRNFASSLIDGQLTFEQLLLFSRFPRQKGDRRFWCLRTSSFLTLSWSLSGFQQWFLLQKGGWRLLFEVAGGHFIAFFSCFLHFFKYLRVLNEKIWLYQVLEGIAHEVSLICCLILACEAWLLHQLESGGVWVWANVHFDARSQVLVLRQICRLHLWAQ